MSAALTILTWLWAQPGGATIYTAAHVNAWASMVRRNLSLPHRVACVTDMPSGISSDVEIIPPPGDFVDINVRAWERHRPQCFRRLAMFRPDAGEIFGGRFASMDLDCIVTGSLDPLFNRAEDIVLYRSPPGSKPADRLFNGSMLMMSAGARPQVFTDFDPVAAAKASARLFGSDQAWISSRLGADEATWSEADGVYWVGRWSRSKAAQCRLVFCLGQSKPWDLLPRHALARAYRSAGRAIAA